MTGRLRRQSVRTMVDQPPVEQIAAQSAVVPETEAPGAPVVASLPETAVPVIQAEQSRPTPAPPVVKRSKLGWQVRDDLILACKRHALDQRTHDYEVLERLLDYALAHSGEVF